MRLFRSPLAALAIVTLALPLAAPMAAAPALAASYSIDNAHTSVLFKTTHLGVSPFWGRFNSVTGTFDYDAAKPELSKVRFEIDVNSIFTADKKRDDHLKGPDFFSAKQFPKITFESTAVKSGKAAGSLSVTGALTIRGVKKTITVELAKTGEGKDPWGGERIGFEGSFVINRLDYGVSYMPEGLGKDVTIVVAVEGIKG